MQWLLSLLFPNQEFSACERTHITLGKKPEQLCKQYLIMPSSALAFPDWRFLWFKLWRLISRFTYNSDFRDLELSRSDRNIQRWNSQTSGAFLNWLSRECSNQPPNPSLNDYPHTAFPPGLPFPVPSVRRLVRSVRLSRNMSNSRWHFRGKLLQVCSAGCNESSHRAATHPSHLLNNWVTIQELFKSPAVFIIYITSLAYC